MPQYNSGDPCPNGCGGQIVIRSSRLSGCRQYYHQYLRCTGCNWADVKLTPTGRVHVKGQRTGRTVV